VIRLKITLIVDKNWSG